MAQEPRTPEEIKELEQEIKDATLSDLQLVKTLIETEIKVREEKADRDKDKQPV